MVAMSSVLGWGRGVEARAPCVGAPQAEQKWTPEDNSVPQEEQKAMKISRYSLAQGGGSRASDFERQTSASDLGDESVGVRSGS